MSALILNNIYNCKIYWSCLITLVLQELLAFDFHRFNKIFIIYCIMTYRNVSVNNISPHIKTQLRHAGKGNLWETPLSWYWLFHNNEINALRSDTLIWTKKPYFNSLCLFIYQTSEVFVTTSTHDVSTECVCEGNWAKFSCSVV